MKPHAAAVIPCNDLALSRAFYASLGFEVDEAYEGYVILRDHEGSSLHLSQAEPGWVENGRNPFGVYVYARDVEARARSVGATCEAKPWGMTEFAVSDPDGTLVRVGWER